MRRLKGWASGGLVVLEQKLDEKEARYVLAVGRVPVAGLLLILCTARTEVLRNEVR